MVLAEVQGSMCLGASADVWEKSRDKTVFIPMVGMAEPQGRVLGSDATVASDQHCPVTAFQHCLLVMRIHEVGS